MVITCGACGNAMEVEGELSNGQCVVCPICGEQTQFDKPTRIEIPTGAVRRAESVASSGKAFVAADVVPKEKPKLRVIRNRNPGDESVNPVDRRKIHLAEERLKMYEELKHKAWRRKFLTNLFSVIVLIALPIVGWFIYTEWEAHAKQLEHEAELRAAEEQARVELEEKVRREQLEKERQEREARLAEERIARQRAMELEQEERKRLENQKKVMEEQYRALSFALCENEFDLFNKNVTNDLTKVGGELCYCFPSDKPTIPFYLVTYSTNGVDMITEMLPDGTTADVDYDLFELKVCNQDYIVARENKVYFHSRKKNKRIGELPKDRPIDPAEVFFGDLSNTLERLKPTYDELTFDIVFVPAGSAKQIECENVEFGSKCSPASVREAVENAFPPKKTSKESPAKIKKFKRTVKFWNGSYIKQGVDDITYVPRTYGEHYNEPRYYYRKHHHRDRITPLNPSNGEQFRVIWHTGTRSGPGDIDRAGQTYTRWRTLYDQALREEEAEVAYYERENRRHVDMVDSKRFSEDAAWLSKIDKIISEGKLYYRIKKAKRKDSFSVFPLL